MARILVAGGLYNEDSDPAVSEARRQFAAIAERFGRDTLPAGV